MTNVIVAEGYIQSDAERKTVGHKQTTLVTFALVNTTGFGEHKNTNYFDCELWGKLGDSLHQYLSEGTRLTVTGTMYHNRYTNSDGQKRQRWVVKVRELSLGGRQNNTENSSQAKGPAYPTPQQAAFDDDIPF
jgi:single-strand DNA-binding protein